MTTSGIAGGHTGGGNQSRGIDRISSLGVDPSATIIADTAFSVFELLEGDDGSGSGSSGDGDGNGPGGGGGKIKIRNRGKSRNRLRGDGSTHGDACVDGVDELEVNERLRAAFGDDAAAGWSYAHDFQAGRWGRAPHQQHEANPNQPSTTRINTQGNHRPFTYLVCDRQALCDVACP